MRGYHDHEWGVPSHDDAHLFEMIVLEGAQAGLSWASILRRRDGYRSTFEGLDPATLAQWDDERLAQALTSPSIIRNRAKVWSVRGNARVFTAVQQAHGSFSSWVWDHVDGQTIINHPRTMAELEPESDLSRTMSHELKTLGMRFVGPVIVQSFLEAIGVVDDHLVGCPAKRG